MDEAEKRRRFEAGKLSYKGFDIVAKRDFGANMYYDQGFYHRDGFIVSKGSINMIPGAGWFRTVEDAKEAADISLIVGEQGFNEAYAKLQAAKKQLHASFLSELQADIDAEAAPSGPRL